MKLNSTLEYIIVLIFIGMSITFLYQTNNRKKNLTQDKEVTAWENRVCNFHETPITSLTSEH